MGTKRTGVAMEEHRMSVIWTPHGGRIKGCNVWHRTECPPVPTQNLQSRPVLPRDGKSCTWSGGGGQRHGLRFRSPCKGMFEHGIRL
jgi:hypothetical protein